MGNTVPPRMCREAGTGAGTSPVGRRPKSVVTETAAPAAAPRRVVVTPLKQRRDKEEEEVTRVRGGRTDDDVGRAPTGTVVTVKIVMKRKDAEALVARLNAQNARERKARMAELKGELRAGDGCGGGGGGSLSPCRDAWRPRLAPIQEN